jgi:hypothetical protein
MTALVMAAAERGAVGMTALVMAAAERRAVMPWA